MALLTAQLVLDALDENNAIFRGVDAQDIPVQTPFGPGGMMVAQYPALCLHRSTWEDMGTPTLISVTVDRALIPEDT